MHVLTYLYPLTHINKLQGDAPKWKAFNPFPTNKKNNETRHVCPFLIPFPIKIQESTAKYYPKPGRIIPKRDPTKLFPRPNMYQKFQGGRKMRPQIIKEMLWIVPSKSLFHNCSDEISAVPHKHERLHMDRPTSTPHDWEIEGTPFRFAS